MRLIEFTWGDSTLFDSDEEDLAGDERESLAVALVDACRGYRLGEAAGLLRSLVLLGSVGDRVVLDAVDFLVRQQTPGGAFGYTATDADHVRAADQRNCTQCLLVALSEFEHASSRRDRANSKVGRP